METLDRPPSPHDTPRRTPERRWRHLHLLLLQPFVHSQSLVLSQLLVPVGQGVQTALTQYWVWLPPQTFLSS